jgi:hypothetical protein
MLDLSGLDTCPPLRRLLPVASGVSWTFYDDWASVTVAALWISGVIMDKGLRHLGPPAQTSFLLSFGKSSLLLFFGKSSRAKVDLGVSVCEAQYVQWH